MDGVFLSLNLALRDEGRDLGQETIQVFLNEVRDEKAVDGEPAFEDLTRVLLERCG
jgi:hypothetical protein